MEQTTKNLKASEAMMSVAVRTFFKDRRPAWIKNESLWERACADALRPLLSDRLQPTMKSSQGLKTSLTLALGHATAFCKGYMARGAEDA